MEMKTWGDWFQTYLPTLVQAVTDIFKVLKYKKENPDTEETTNEAKNAMEG